MSTPLDVAQVRELIAEARAVARVSCAKCGDLGSHHTESTGHDFEWPIRFRLADALEATLGVLEQVSAMETFVEAAMPCSKGALYAMGYDEAIREVRSRLTGDQQHG